METKKIKNKGLILQRKLGQQILVNMGNHNLLITYSSFLSTGKITLELKGSREFSIFRYEMLTDEQIKEILWLSKDEN